MSAVWVTGLGCISAVGRDAPATLDGVARALRPQSFPRLFSHVDVETPLCAVPDDWLAPLPGGDSWRDHTTRDSQALLRHAMREALESAGFPADAHSPAVRDSGGVGVCIGTTAGCSPLFLQDYIALRDGRTQETYQCVDAYFSNSPALSLAAEWGLGGGPALTVSNACTSGSDAVGLAARWVASGLCDVAFAGGADALSETAYIGFNRLMIVSKEPCRPFDRERAGLNLGEGAAVLVLESPAHARKRGVAPRAVLSGYGSACDAHHISSPHPTGRGLRAAVDRALAMSGLSMDDIAFINAHGTATLENDKIESLVYGQLPKPPRLWASKGSTGHCLGAAGAVEAVLTVLALEKGEIPASTGCEYPEEAVASFITRRPTALEGAHAMSMSLGFGGGNAALVFSRPEEGRS